MPVFLHFLSVYIMICSRSTSRQPAESALLARINGLVY